MSEVPEGPQAPWARTVNDRRRIDAAIARSRARRRPVRLAHSAELEALLDALSFDSAIEHDQHCRVIEYWDEAKTWAVHLELCARRS